MTFHRIIRRSAPPWLAFAVPLLALYAPTLLKDVAFWDTGEMQTVPYIFGIAHPTGFPFFVLAGGVFSHLLPWGTVAWRLSLFSACAMAIAAAAVCMLACELGAEPLIGMAGAWSFAAGEVAWTRAVRAEVHAPAVMFAMLALTCAARFRRTGKASALSWCALWLGLGLATHPVTVLTIPGLLLLAWRRHEPERGSRGDGSSETSLPAMWVRVCGIVSACLALYAYLPLRSWYVYEHRLDPTLGLGIAPGRPYWDYGHPSSWSGFLRAVSGQDFHVSGALMNVFHPERYATMAITYAHLAVKEVGLFAASAALVGVAFALHRAPIACLGIFLAAVSAVPFVFAYAAESDTDRYLLISYAVIVAYAAAGLSRLLSIVFRGRNVITALVGVLLLVLPTGLIVLRNAPIVKARVRDLNARAWVERVRAETPTNALIIADWNSSTPLAYAAYVERDLDERIIETAWVWDDQAYLPRWMMRYPVYLSSSEAPYLPGYAFDLVDKRYPVLYRVRTTR